MHMPTTDCINLQGWKLNIFPMVRVCILYIISRHGRHFPTINSDSYQSIICNVQNSKCISSSTEIYCSVRTRLLVKCILAYTYRCFHSWDRPRIHLTCQTNNCQNGVLSKQSLCQRNWPCKDNETRRTQNRWKPRTPTLSSDSQGTPSCSISSC